MSNSSASSRIDLWFSTRKLLSMASPRTLTPLRASKPQESASVFKDLRGGVVVVVLVGRDAVEALAAVGRPFHDPEGAVGDGGQQRRGAAVVHDPLQQVDGLVEHVVDALLDEAARGGDEVLVQPAGGVEHV